MSEYLLRYLHITKNGITFLIWRSPLLAFVFSSISVYVNKFEVAQVEQIFIYLAQKHI